MHPHQAGSSNPLYPHRSQGIRQLNYVKIIELELFSYLAHHEKVLPYQPLSGRL